MLVPFALALLAGLATAIGGALVLVRRRLGSRFLAVSLGLSAGVMLYVSFVELLATAERTLTAEYGQAGAWWTILGFFGGIALIGVIDRLVPAAINPHELSGADDASDRHRASMLRTGVITAAALALHNFPEGFAVFLAATQEVAVAVPVVVAIAIHNIPEGIAVAVPVAYATGSPLTGFGYSVLAGLAEPVGALVGYLLLQAFLGPVAMAIAFAGVAGIMVFVSLDELLPAAHDFGHHHATIYGLVAGMGIMAASLAVL
ncbi:zinc transporter ZupT [Mobilicoccus massiliensis]|uniref:zinc transporter ZupT n=1 Tax=Mobilicoccus massiliensis TaxID=1522310 RepID=UPI000AE214E2|nr:zinc transporter ZupT [Mobilicoccus massiliensis]